MNELADVNTVVDLPQQAHNLEHHQLTSVCNGLYQVPLAYACDSFGVATSAEPLYIEGMKSIMVEMEGDYDILIHVLLDAYALRVVPFLTVAPVGREKLPSAKNDHCARHNTVPF